MSVTKRTPAEIAKALMEVISDQEGEPLNKKLRHTTRKNKTDEKKEKQVVASVCKVLLQNKDDKAGELRPLRILSPSSSLLCSSGNLLEIKDVIESK